MMTRNEVKPATESLTPSKVYQPCFTRSRTDIHVYGSSDGYQMPDADHVLLRYEAQHKQQAAGKSSGANREQATRRGSVSKNDRHVLFKENVTSDRATNMKDYKVLSLKNKPKPAWV
mmetsp:Transcript_18359/g.46024  ORF Transcript_18359/g.46024 Transcript_18359/m.46024 type:complete len:117 (-) Transcript_18359:77-427(-)